MPDIGAEIANLQKLNLPKEEFLAKKDTLVRDYSIKSERIHSINQLLKAYTLFESNLIHDFEVGTSKGLQQIHGYLFGGLYDFAGQIREKSISKGGYQFVYAQHLNNALQQIDALPQSTLEEILVKYAEMNKAHPFMEGNGRSSRIWLDMMLKKQLKKCVDWSKISKENYMNAMIISTVDSSVLKQLLETALTTKINDREMFMKGIDYSYYYEE
jgi:cell filamentation protein